MRALPLFSSLLAAAVLTLLVGIWACDSSDSDEAQPVQLDRLIRLGDRLAQARVSGARAREVRGEFHPIGDSKRLALVLPNGVDVIFDDLLVSPKARLQTTLRVPAKLPENARLDISVRERGTWRSLQEGPLPAAGGQDVPLDLPLGLPAAATTAIRFRLTAESGDVWCFEPSVRSDGRQVIAFQSDLPGTRLADDVVMQFDLLTRSGALKLSSAPDEPKIRAAKPPTDVNSKTSEPMLLVAPSLEAPAEIEAALKLPPDALLEVAAFQDFGTPEELLALTEAERDALKGGVRFTVLSGDTILWQHDLVRGPSLESIRAGKTIDLSELGIGEATLRFRTEYLAGTQRRSKVVAWEMLRLVAREPRPRQLSRDDAPNVVLVMVDTLRPDHLSCYGYPKVTSPNLDAFAADGVRYEQAISSSSWTLPAIATLFTGLASPLAHGVFDHERAALSASHPTLAEIVAARGGLTSAFVANPIVSVRTNYDQGFDRFEEPGDNAVEITDGFLSWLEAYSGYRFFAYLHYYDPHNPYDAPGEYREQFCDADYAGFLKGIDEPVNQFRDQAWRALQADPEGVPQKLRDLSRLFGAPDRAYLQGRYDGEIRYWDDQFQRVLDALEERGIDDRTWVIVVGDHGDEFFEHDGLGHGHTLHSELTRVPMIIRGPGVEPTVIRQSVSISGLFYTIASLFGARIEGRMNESPLPGLPKTPTPKEQPIFTAVGKGQMVTDAMYGVRDERWKMIWRPATRTAQLYSWRDDPFEQKDLSDKNRAEIERLQKLFESWRVQSEAIRPSDLANTDPETIEKMRQMGYLGSKSD